MSIGEMIVGMAGGGALTGLVQFLLTLRQNRRQMNSSALGGEIDALNSTIKLLQHQLESSAAYYETEIERLRREVLRLRDELDAISGKRVEKRSGDAGQSVCPASPL